MQAAWTRHFQHPCCCVPTLPQEVPVHARSPRTCRLSISGHYPIWFGLLAGEKVVEKVLLLVKTKVCFMRLNPLTTFLTCHKQYHVYIPYI